MEDQVEQDKPAILVVDDSRLMRVAARKILKEHFVIEEAEDGEAAWEMILEDRAYAVVMSDLSMPHLDGLGLLERIRSSTEERIRDLPVVIVTGAEDDSAAKEQALARGANDFITKPFDSVQLVARTKAQIRLQETTQALEETTEALEKQSNLDPLTGLLNQAAFTERGQKDLAYAVRHQTSLGLIRIEILDFNKAFLRHGKAAAEQMIQDTAELLKSLLRREDTGGRIGMNQFGILLPAFSAQGTHQLTERMAEQITAQRYGFGAVQFNAGISVQPIGVDAPWDELLAGAERYLAEAKQQGGNRVAWDENAALDVTATSTTQAPDTDATDLARALTMLRNGEEDELVEQLDTLMIQCLPLLECWDRHHGSRLSVCVNTLRRRLGLEIH